MDKKRKLFLGLGLLAIIIGIVSNKLFSRGFEFAGTIEATRIDLPARVATVIKSIEVDEGQQVKKGEVIASLACEDLELSQNLAEENYQRALKLKQTGSISKEAFDQAQNRKQDADTRMGWCKIKSPVDGRVLTRFLDPSEWVNPGTKVLTVANLEDLWTYFYVPQELMSKLKLGSQVIGRVPEIDREFPGTIIKINDEAEFTPKNVQTQSERTRLVFGIKTSFKNSDGALKPGMTIQSTLVSK